MIGLDKNIRAAKDDIPETSSGIWLWSWNWVWEVVLTDMKYGIHFGHLGSWYDELGVRECLKQAKEAGSDVFEFFPTKEMLDMEKDKIRELKMYMEEIGIEPAFTFG